MGEDVFDGVPSGFEINVPSDSVDDYQNTPGWSDYSDKINPIVKVESVSVSPTTVTLNVGATTALAATVLPADADNKNVVWSSSNPAIATVNANGVVTAVAEGNCVITVTTLDGGKTAQCAATIESATVHVTGVTVSPTVMTINVGETSAVTATVLPADATDKSVTWTSSNPSVATVDASGNVTAIAEGNANITVRTTDGNYTAQCAATVEAQPQPTAAITYTASRKLEVDLTAFTPAATNETYDSATSAGTIEFTSDVTAIGAAAFTNQTSLTAINIPDSVTSIGNQAFLGCSNLTSIDIPDSVKSIGNYAFNGCSGLISVTIGNGVTSIVSYAFVGCSNLESITIEATTPPFITDEAFIDTNNCPIYVPCESVAAYKAAENWSTYADRIQCVTPPTPATGITYTASRKLEVDLSAFTPSATSEDYDSATHTGVIGFNAPVTAIGAGAFYGKDALKSIDIPNSVTSISEHAFENCLFTSVTIPDSVTSIGEAAFMDCDKLTNVTIGTGITSIIEKAFKGCYRLTSVTVNAVTPPTLGEETFNDTNNCPIYVPCESVNTYKAAAGWSNYSSRIQCATPPTPTSAITYVSNCKLSVEPTRFTPNVVEETYDETTHTGIIKFNAPVTAIGDYGFYYEGCLTSIVIPDSVTSIGEQAFYECTGLTSVTIPDSVTSIGNWAFAQCKSLPNITIPDSVTSFGNEVFGGCSGLTSCTIGNGVTSISQQTFQECTILRSCTIGSGVTSIGNGAFNKCTNLPNITIPNSVTSIGDNAFNKCTSLSSVTIPDSVTSIGQGAFNDCSGMTSCTIGSGITSIEYATFQNCYSLTSVTIPDSVTTIRERNFYHCSGLTTCTIGSGVTSISGTCFDSCTALETLTVNAVTPPTLENGVFSNVPYTMKVYVPCESVDAYKAKPIWRNFDIQCVTPPQPAMPITYTATSQLTISLLSFTPAATGHSFNNGVGTIEFASSVTAIGLSAFDGSTGLTAINIPDSVTSIGERAFGYCTGLTSIDIPDSVTSIDRAAFNSCYGLTSVTIPDSVRSIGVSAFGSCENLTSVTIETGITSISYGAFENCYDLTSVTVKATTPPTLGEDVFNGAPSTFKIYVPCASVNTYKTTSGWSAWANWIQCATPSHEYVDLGLPSGTKWATMNVGATSETEYGNYYQYGKGSAQYAATSGQSDYSGTENPLAASVDTATQVWGSEWHMPTKAQFEELTANTTFTWETNFNGSRVNGAKFTAQNGNYVFFPAAGSWRNGVPSGAGMVGSCWSSSNPSNYGRAYSLDFSNGGKNVNHSSRNYGYSIRPVVG